MKKSLLGILLFLNTVCISVSAQFSRNQIIELERELVNSERPLTRNSLQFLDQLAYEKTDHLAHELWRQCLKKNSKGVVPRKVFQETQILFEDYLLKRTYYSTAKDQQRTSSFRKLLLSAKICLNLESQNNLSIPNRRLPKLAWELLISKSSWLSLKSVTFASQQNYAQNLNNWAHVGHIIGTEFFQGRSLKWSGEEHLNDPRIQNPPRNTINIVVMNHANGHLDKLYLAELMLRIPGKAGIVALAQGFRNDWAFSVAQSNKFIHMVGERKSKTYNSTIEDILESAKLGMNVLYVNPEGSSGVGIGEIKPLAPGFIKRLLPRLLATYEVNILPITALGAYTKLGDLSLPMDGSVVIDPLILDTQLRSFYEMPNAYSEVDFQIRSIWLKHLDTLEDRIFGQYKLMNLEKHLKIDSRDHQNCSESLIVDNHRPE